MKRSTENKNFKSTYNYSSFYVKHMVCDMSSYELSHSKTQLHDLDLITTYHQQNANLVCTEFETQYQSASHNIKATNLSESKI